MKISINKRNFSELKLNKYKFKKKDKKEERNKTDIESSIDIKNKR